MSIMGNKRSQGKIFIIIGAILAYFSVFSYFLLDSLGAWWLVEVDPVLGTTQTSYLNAFGYVGETGGDLQQILGLLGIFGAIIFLIGPLLGILSKDRKTIAYLGFFCMTGAISIFLYGLANVQDYESILENLSFITGDEYLVFFGTVDLGLLGIWTWMLGIGFYIALAGTITILIGAIKLK
jgi:hypothetical protein